MRKYNILVKIINIGGVYIILDSFGVLIEEINNFNKYSMYGNMSFEEIINEEKRTFEELKNEMERRKISIGEVKGKYKIISGNMEEIIEEIRKIILLGEII
jgi:hypothetical protein